jgi:ribonuclease P protein component
VTLSSGASADSREFGADAPITSARIGLVVGKPVGGSVVRHQVSRRLRAQLSARLDRIPVGARVVVRALPGAATAGSHQLGQDLDRALSRILRETDSRK